jgi:hypothetical protein
MEYKGKLYGKIKNNYFPLQETSEDIENMRIKIKQLEGEVSYLREYKNGRIEQDEIRCSHFSGSDPMG